MRRFMSRAVIASALTGCCIVAGATGIAVQVQDAAGKPLPDTVV